MTNQPGTDTSAAARLLIDQMQRERRSFWGILGVFFVLLAGIGGMIVYQMHELKILAERSQAMRFAEIGEQSLALSALRSGQNTAALAQREAVTQRLQAQRETGVAWGALRATPQSLEPAATRYAKEHLLGRSLNQSTAMVVTGALDAPGLSRPLRALFEAALLDWNMPDTMTPSELSMAWPQVEALSQVLAGDSQLGYFGHAARAAYRFRQAASGTTYMDWDGGCRELIDDSTAALSVWNPALAAAADPAAAGLNLHYWRGQCWRRKGETAKAMEEFEIMMRLVGSEEFPASNPLKYQAFHGMGTVMTTLLDEGEKSSEQRAQETRKALDYLTKAGEFRGQAGMTAVGRVSSTENIGFLLLKEQTTEGLIKTLEHTGATDAIHTSTWNLVARLVAARALQRQEFPQAFSDDNLSANAAKLQETYSEEGLKEIVFRTLAKLAYQSKSSLPKTELRKMLDPEHHSVLDEAADCIEQRIECYEGKNFGRAT